MDLGNRSRCKGWGSNKNEQIVLKIQREFLIERKESIPIFNLVSVQVAKTGACSCVGPKQVQTCTSVKLNSSQKQKKRSTLQYK